MKRVTGLGGIFFKTSDVAKTKSWYEKHLGFKTHQWGATFVWGDNDPSKIAISRTEWSPMATTEYFQPSTHPYMFNYRVHDLRALIDVLKTEGVEIAGDIQEFEYGKFGWIIDPEGRKLELWEPVDNQLGDSPEVWNERVTGVGGVFFKSADPKSIKEWYQKHLNIGQDTFTWRDLSDPDSENPGMTIWSPFKESTDYFNPSDKPWMFNYRVKDIRKLIETLRSEGVTVVGDVQAYDYGVFGWILDCDGTKIELWQP